MSKTKGEIERYIRAAGGKDFVSGTLEEREFVMFKAKGLMIRFTIPRPSMSEFRKDKRGLVRSDNVIARHFEQGLRECWRRLYLVIKAKLESASSGVETFEEAFLAQTVLSNNVTVGEWAKEAIPLAMAGRTAPMLALGPAKPTEGKPS